MSLINQIAEADDLKTSTVKVPEWGVDITLQEMSGFQRAEFEQSVASLSDSEDPKDSVRMMALVIVMTAIDGEGNPEFSDADIDILSGKSLKILKKLSSEAMSLSELSDGDVEELAKN